ncbi:MAG: MmgE/PrpD family protein [Chloroflexi bacterium]|nr:MmgE/PrpD family protein [Chloroflexota bacterium]
MEATRTLAAFAATLRFEDLPPEVVQKATLVLLDFVGNTFGGNVLAETKPLLAYVRALGGDAPGHGAWSGLQDLPPDCGLRDGSSG